MHVNTNRYGQTVLHGHIAQAPTLESRVTKVLATYGLTSPRVHARAVALVTAHPSLTAQQAVDFVINNLHHTVTPA